MPAEDQTTLVRQVVSQMREMLISGEMTAGEKLSEHKIAAHFGISRNTLREAFRELTAENLLDYQPHRGVFVAAPDAGDIIDIYRARHIIQGGAVRAANPGHPALLRMAQIVDEAKRAQHNEDWRAVGTANIAFHRAMVDLSDSARLTANFENLLAELRLAFGQMHDDAFLHGPFVPMNAELLHLLQDDKLAAAAAYLETYLIRSERSLLAALTRGHSKD
ncbi:GntR family transcriptional regulator [Ketogulonicigenium vulgare]|nr:GntR family transcriptional regulator [Ketogulonicigenium vulgare]ADO43611.1 HTH-type transcriptional regulator ydhC [Ketogulonicigenium vulgare Y25]ALJ82418.1 GntR family transcriptional regulator [Ketogulonicigenium vulgare]ANW34627.1 GntR family transcriptional regulator [Ketogulonicigenium vulgare]